MQGPSLKGQGGQRPNQMNVDITNLQDVSCEECGNNTFEQVYIVKKISKIVSPNGEEGLAPVEVFECSECGTIPDELNPLKDLEEDQSQNQGQNGPSSQIPDNIQV
jgi:hypothetical protein